MMQTGGSEADQQGDAFLSANRRARRGGADAAICGARTRTGTVCQNLPIREGKGRCLRHAGPHAAREHRERQRNAFLSGRISAAEWNRAEARRAANRLGWEWKRNPWVPGRTIDLGAAEDDLRADLGQRGLDMDRLAPAVADWLRWRYRRTQIDRRNDRGWLRVVLDMLPGRIARAGACPAGAAGPGLPTQDTTAEDRDTGMDRDRDVGGTESMNATDRMLDRARTWTAHRDGATPPAASKRRLPDGPRAPRVLRGKGYLRPGKPRTQPADADETGALMALYRDHRAVVGPSAGAMATGWRSCAPCAASRSGPGTGGRGRYGWRWSRGSARRDPPGGTRGAFQPKRRRCMIAANRRAEGCCQ